MKRAEDLAGILAAVQADMQAHLGHGKVADYIPALARVDPKHFGMAVMTVDGDLAVTGEADAPFSIQSISKVFTLTMALEKAGSGLWNRVGREPSGSRFNSMVRLEQEHGVPRNPLINAGAIVVCDVLLGQGLPNATIGRITDFLRELTCDPGVSVDMEVAQSEADTGFRNASLANFLKASGNLEGPVEDVLDVYFHQCALAMSCRQLARAGLYLAAGGHDPLTGARITTAVRTRRINAIMMTCGHYDASGEFAFRVGIPGKSGVGGGILAVAPRRGVAAVWSPGLNAAGTSHVGALALERFASLAGWSVFWAFGVAQAAASAGLAKKNRALPPGGRPAVPGRGGAKSPARFDADSIDPGRAIVWLRQQDSQKLGPIILCSSTSTAPVTSDDTERSNALAQSIPTNVEITTYLILRTLTRLTMITAFSETLLTIKFAR